MPASSADAEKMNEKMKRQYEEGHQQPASGHEGRKMFSCGAIEGLSVFA